MMRGGGRGEERRGGSRRGDRHRRGDSGRNAREREEEDEKTIGLRERESDKQTDRIATFLLELERFI